MNPKYLESFLREPDKDIALWKKKQKALLAFYRTIGNHDARMRFLAILAMDIKPKYTLEKRHEFLNMANHVCKQIQSSANSRQTSAIADLGIFAEQLSKALQACNVQIDIHKRLLEEKDSRYKHRIETIDSQLFDLNRLEDFALETSLFPVILKIMQLQNRTNDTENVIKAWEGIVRQTLMKAENAGKRRDWL